MKTISKLILCYLSILCLTVNAQQSQQKIEMKLDSLGNAKLKISTTMSAQQWQIWNANFGNNPSALKREMERSMPAYFLEDFKLDKDDMNRSFSLSLTALGVCKIDRSGKWSFQTDQKDANISEITNHKYMLVSVPLEYGGMVQQTFYVEFPEAAKNVEVSKDAFGKSVFSFDMEGPKSNSFDYIRTAGILLVLIGGGWSGKNLFTQKQ